MKKSILDGYIPEKELAKQLGKTVRTLQLWRLQCGGPPYIKVGSAIHYSEDGVRVWLQSLEVKPQVKK